jgi:hypothetical protein
MKPQKILQGGCQCPAVIRWVMALSLLCMPIPPVNGASVYCTLESDYTATVDPGMTIQLADLSTIHVQTDATFNLIGTSGSPITLTHEASGTYTFEVYGTIAARYTIFEYMGASGINVTSLGAIDTTNNFSDCIFQNGTTGGACLTVENAQDFRAGHLGSITGAQWGTGATYNARKTGTQGYLQFASYSGALGGESYDDDANNRISWSGATPTPTATPSGTATPPPVPTETPHGLGLIIIVLSILFVTTGLRRSRN